MAGPIIASLGGFGFEAHGFSLDSISRNLKTSWAKVKTPGGFDQLQFLGGEGETVKIAGVLFPHIYGGMESLEGIRASAKAGNPLHLIQHASKLRVGIPLGLFAIEGVSDKQDFIGPDGVAMRDTYSLDLTLYSSTSVTSGFSLNGFL